MYWRDTPLYLGIRSGDWQRLTVYLKVTGEVLNYNSLTDSSHPVKVEKCG
jgi:hypothetical protein